MKNPTETMQFQVEKPNGGLKREFEGTSAGNRNTGWIRSRTSSSPAECKILPHLGNRRSFFVDKENWVAYDFCTAFSLIRRVHPPSVLDL